MTLKYGLWSILQPLLDVWKISHAFAKVLNFWRFPHARWVFIAEKEDLNISPAQVISNHKLTSSWFQPENGNEIKISTVKKVAHFLIEFKKSVWRMLSISILTRKKSL